MNSFALANFKFESKVEVELVFFFVYNYFEVIQFINCSWRTERSNICALSTDVGGL